jgi:hypothetical protein
MNEDMTDTMVPYAPIPVPTPHHSVEVDKIFGALAKAQSQMGGAVKQKENPFFKSSYADLASVVEAVREPLTANGLAHYQYTHEGDGATVTVVCVLAHSSGQWILSSLTLKPNKADAQGIGGAITYARRYTLSGLCGLPQVDDDGEAAVTHDDAAESTPVLEDLIAKELGGKKVDSKTRKAAKKGKPKTGDIPGYKPGGKITEKQKNQLWDAGGKMAGNRGDDAAKPIMAEMLKRLGESSDGDSGQHKKVGDIPAALFKDALAIIENIDQPSG